MNYTMPDRYEMDREMAVFVAKKYLRQCDNYDRATLASVLDTIADLDLQSKNGLLTPERALELIIAM